MHLKSNFHVQGTVAHCRSHHLMSTKKSILIRSPRRTHICILANFHLSSVICQLHPYTRAACVRFVMAAHKIGERHTTKLAFVYCHCEIEKNKTKMREEKEMKWRQMNGEIKNKTHKHSQNALDGDTGKKIVWRKIHRFTPQQFTLFSWYTIRLVTGSSNMISFSSPRATRTQQLN